MNHFGHLVSYDYNYHGNFGTQALILRTEVFYLEYFNHRFEELLVCFVLN